MVRRLIITLILLQSVVFAQQKIEVSTYKITHFYFPSDIVSPDIGFPDDFDLISEGKELKLTSIPDGFDYETNLTVKTKNALYAFFIKYSDNPENLYLFPSTSDAVKIFEDRDEKEKVEKAIEEKKDVDFMEKDCLHILSMVNSKRDVCALSDDKSIGMCIKNIYVHDTLMYFPVFLENMSNVDFDMAVLALKIKVKEAVKLSAEQEEYLEPFYILNNSTQTVKAGETVKKVIVTRRFTISSKKELVLEAVEENGSRQAKVALANKSLLKAKRL
jgi:hypothetical protein